MDFITGLAVIGFIHLLAAASPGPDFVMVTQYSLVHGKRIGIMASLGISLGLSVHIAYSALGLATVIAGSTSAITVVRLLGGAFLIYLGISGLRSQGVTNGGAKISDAPVSARSAVVKGFFCNLLNPKAPLYFVSLFTIVISEQLPASQLLAYGVWIMLIQMAWFSLLASLLSIQTVRQTFQRLGVWLDRILGGVMLLLGLKILATKSI